MRWWIPLAAATLLLAACQPPAAEEPSDAEPVVAEQTESPSPDASAPADLPGEYRLAGVGADAIDLPHGITVSISRDRIAVQSDCVNFAWSYRFDGNALETERQAVESCERALLPEEAAIEAAFDSATSVERTPANGIRFSGSGKSVTLFSQ